MENQTLLSVRDLRVKFRLDKHDQHHDFEAVRGVNFDIPENSTVALVGESGSGKSVTSLSILGLLPPENSKVGGQVVFEGRDLLTLDAHLLRDLRGARLAMIFSTRFMVR